jgi:IrrE N-terminal-like domain
MRNSRSAFVIANAKQVLKDAGITEPPVPVEDLVRARGLSITQGAIPDGWGYFHPDTWSVTLSPSLYREIPANRNRRRFTLAHELGHCVLEHGDRSCWNLGAVAEPTALEELDDFPDFEREAHQFARELLLPRTWFKRDWEKDLDPERCERLYGVSRGTLVVVLMERRLLTKTRKPR